MAREVVDVKERDVRMPIRRSTRIEQAELEAEEEWDETTTPRLGRRESEPHSHQVSYLFDVLSTNFPNDRTLWDLHHYFWLDGEEIDLQFDISYFRNFQIPYTLSSYRASEHGNRVPTMVVNVLSRSTFYKDIGITVDRCYRLGIPVYVVFNPYLVHIRDYRAPFLRVYYRAESDRNFYSIKELRTVSFREDGTVDPARVIDVGSIIPFKLGIQQFPQKHQQDLPQYRLVLFNPTTLEVLKTTAEQERQRAEQERQRAEEALKKLKELEEKLKKIEAERGDID